jgi:uncharacterized SAM-binding protein YcdF (DUF218 family)
VIFGAAVRPDGQPSRALRQRTEAAFACGGTQAHYVPTGAVGRYGAAEAQVMADLLRGFGVPEQQITLELTGTNTMSSARACAKLLQSRPGPVRVATSGYHMLRCRMLLRRFGVTTTPCPPPPASARWRTRWYWRAREAVAIPVDFALSCPGLARR